MAIIVMENQSYETVVGSSSMPYFNGLIRQGGLATNYYANAHPSLPNYFMLTVGQLVTDSDTFTGTVTDDNIVRELVVAGKTWKGYFESLPTPGYLGDDVPPYMRHHNPFAYFSDLSQSPQQAVNMVGLPQLSSDITNGALPNYMFIVPDVTHDGHTCPPAIQNCTPAQLLAQVDNFLATTAGPLLSSPAFQPNGLLIVLWDEADRSDVTGGGGHVATVLVGSHVKPGYQSTTLYQHQNVLRTTADVLGFKAPGAAANATAMAEFFQ